MQMDFDLHSLLEGCTRVRDEEWTRFHRLDQGVSQNMRLIPLTRALCKAPDATYRPNVKHFTSAVMSDSLVITGSAECRLRFFAGSK